MKTLLSSLWNSLVRAYHSKTEYKVIAALSLLVFFLLWKMTFLPKLQHLICPVASAQELTFGDKELPQISSLYPPAKTGKYWLLPGGNDHQNKILRGYQDYLRSQGIADLDTLRRASAILVHENEKLTTDRMGDNNRSYGLCMRNVKTFAPAWLDKHPEQWTAQGQYEYCGQRFIASLDRYAKYKNLMHTETMPDRRKITTTEQKFRVWVAHNCPSACADKGKNTTHLNPPYFQRVQYSYEKLYLY